MGENLGKSDFLDDFNFNKNWGMRDGLFYFIVEFYK